MGDRNTDATDAVDLIGAEKGVTNGTGVLIERQGNEDSN